jgi:hypothetical protein
VTGLLLSALASSGGPNGTAPVVIAATPAPATARKEIRFERDVRTTAESFVARAAGFSLRLTGGDATVALADASFGLRLFGGAQGVQGRAGRQLPGTANYLIGNDPSKWRTSVLAYDRVTYPAVYRGIDLTFYGIDGALEYDFVVAAGADPGQIAVDIVGANHLHVDDDGDLVIRVDGREFRQQRPYAYQAIDATRHPVDVRFALDGNRLSYVVGSYDPSLTLVIDPVIIYSAQFGGTDADSGGAITTDALGRSIIVGSTVSADFPVSDEALQQAKAPGRFDGFLTVIGAEGTLEYSTYFGAANMEVPQDVVIGADGAIYVAGYTKPEDPPQLGGGVYMVGNTYYRPSADACARCGIFAIKFAAGGSRVEYSTFIGSGEMTYEKSVGGISVDGSGRLLIGGITTSRDLPKAETMGGDLPRWYWYGYALRLNAAGTDLDLSRYVTGHGGEAVRGVAIGPQGRLYILGETGNSAFHTRESLYAFKGMSDMFLIVLDSTGATTIKSMLFGTSSWDYPRALALSPEGHVLIAGHSNGADLPLTSGGRASRGGATEPFAIVIDASLDRLRFASYYGGTAEEYVTDAAFDPRGHAIIAGYTLTSELPTLQPVSSTRGSFDLFIAAFDLNGTLRFSTYLGGSGHDGGPAIAHDATLLHLTGYTASADFPRAGGIASQTPDLGNAFFTRINIFGRRVDLDANGRDDVVLQHANGSIQAWLMEGPLVTESRAFTPTRLPAGWSVAGVGDFSRGGRSDDFVIVHDDGRVATWTMRNFRFVDGNVIATLPADWRVVGVSDLNLDGNDDLLVHHRQEGHIGAWLLDGSRRIDGVAFGTVADLQWRPVAAADFDRNGSADVVWQHANGGLAVWYMDRLQRLRVDWLPVALPQGWQVRDARDINGDGFADVLLEHDNGYVGAWFFRYGTGAEYIGGTLLEPPLLPAGWRVVGTR